MSKVRRLAITGLLITAVLAIAASAGSARSATSSRPAGARACKSVRPLGVRQSVQVRIVRGSTPCATADAVIGWMYNSYESSYVRHFQGWTTYGPQTCEGYAKKAGTKITGDCAN